MYIHKHMYTYDCSSIHTRINAYMQVHAHMRTKYKHTHTNIYTYIHTNIHTYIHTSIHPYIHTSIHTYIHPYIHTYIYIYILKSAVNTYKYSCALSLPTSICQSLCACTLQHHPHHTTATPPQTLPTLYTLRTKNFFSSVSRVTCQCASPPFMTAHCPSPNPTSHNHPQTHHPSSVHPVNPM